MYTENDKIPEVYDYVLNENRIYVHRKKGTLQELSLNGEILWESKEIGVRDYNIYNNVIIFNLRNPKGIAYDTYIYDKETKQNWFHEDIILNGIIDNNCYRDVFLYNYKDGQVTVFNLLTGKIDKIMTFKSKGIPYLVTAKYYVEKRGVSIFVYSQLDYSLLWELNLGTLFPHTDVQRREIKEYNDSFIVVTTSGIARLKADDGNVIWKAEGYAATLEIVDNIGYACTNSALYKVDLETGEISGYGWEYYGLPTFIYEGQKHWPIGHKVVYHNGLLWYSVYDYGQSFLIAINPDNGNYEWIHHVDTHDKTRAPQFYGNKMFLMDTGNTLHIYEKEK